MESLLFILDAFAIIVVVFFSLKNDTRRPGTPQIGLFRMAPGGPPDKPDTRRTRRGR